MCDGLPRLVPGVGEWGPEDRRHVGQELGRMPHQLSLSVSLLTAGGAGLPACEGSPTPLTAPRLLLSAFSPASDPGLFSLPPTLQLPAHGLSRLSPAAGQGLEAETEAGSVRPRRWWCRRENACPPRWRVRVHSATVLPRPRFHWAPHPGTGCRPLGFKIPVLEIGPEASSHCRCPKF